MRRKAMSLAVLTFAATLPLQALVPPLASAFPVATSDAAYTAFGRVFPDPHGCTQGAPGTSPWAKGNICAEQFLQYDDVVAGLGFLESKHPRFMELLDLREELGDEYQTAGLPRPDLSRLKSPLTAIKVTDAESTIPEAERKHFIYSMSIHGIERAGIEGGVRAIEDLVTWAACEADPASAPACDAEGPFPKQILEPFDEDSAVIEPNAGPTAGQVSQNAVVYFILSNPDGWRRGDLTDGGVFYQRYNGNGMDLNRDWATIGYTEAQYTPFSEPENLGYASFLKSVRERTAVGHFTGGIDLHGMVTSNSFSFTLLSAGQRDFRKNAISVDTGIRTWQDAEERLTWSNQVARDEDCPGDVPEPFFGRTQGPMCTDQWGTVWDTISYQVTGGIGDWIDSPLGLDGVGINNEMALSHLAPNNAFVAEIEQLHVDGNKGLIYSQIASLLFEQPAEFVPGGKIAYLQDPTRITHAGGEEATPPTEGLPQQEPISETRPDGFRTPFAFESRPVSDGYYNGGIDIRITSSNAQGISPAAAVTWILDYCGPAQGPDDPYDNECREVARYFNQASTYLQAGAQIVLNDPVPGPYQVRQNNFAAPTKIEIEFTAGKAYPVPDQAPYDVSRMDFFAELNEYSADDVDLTPVTVEGLVEDPGQLFLYDTLVIANEFVTEPGSYADAEIAGYAQALRTFVEKGGNLVLTDGAIAGLPSVADGFRPSDILSGFFYAGWVDFNDGAEPTYEHPLARNVDKPGAAEGEGTIDGETFVNRHQTYEPVPLGFYNSPDGAGNDSCTSDKCDAPNWYVDQEAWEAAGGQTAGRTRARSATDAGSESTVGVSLGSLKIGKGRIAIVGSLLPDPSEDNYHPFGLAAYALTYTGYQLFFNATDWDNPAQVTRRPPLGGGDPGGDPGGGALRLAGATRVETAIDISKDGFIDDGADAVVLARSDDYPDALTGAPFALAKNAPMLLTASSALIEATGDEMDRVLEHGATVYLLGGEAALSKDVAAAVEDRGYEVERIGGESRIETSIAISAALDDPDEVLIATGYDFADALAGAAAAGHIGGSVLLTTPDAPHPATTAYLDANASTRWAIGGPAARAYPDAESVSGPTREETSVAVADEFFVDPVVVGIARRDVFADALTGGPHIAALGGPMLVTFTDELHGAVSGYLCAHALDLNLAYIYGGELAVAESVFDAISDRTLSLGC